MQLFSQYLQPLTSWLYANPQWALFITFLISFTESLAIIGSIIPGSVTMTAIGILAGSGVMRIDYTILAAILGAVAGDSGSYFLGYYYSDRLIHFWPFKRYPHWLSLGKDYFSKHGGKSVLIGRFIGPLRSIIPVIAGMMHMSQWRFLVANVLSAIGWSILYLGPGIVIGAASNELSAENATRFFMVILLILICFWLLGLSIKWLLIRVNRLLAINLHQAWLWSQKHPVLAHYFMFLTPSHEENHYPTAALVIVSLLNIIFLVFLLLLSLFSNGLEQINISIHTFLQSIRLPEVDYFFVAINQLIHFPSLVMMFIAVLGVLLFKKKYRESKYFLSLFITSFLIAKGLSLGINIERPPGILVTLPGSSFPQIELTVATAFWSFLIFYVNEVKNTARGWYKMTLLTFLVFSGFSALYLGDNWFSDVLSAYLIGSLLSLLHWIFYRKGTKNKKQNVFSLQVISLAALLMTASITTWQNYPHLIHNHAPYQKQFMLTQEQWFQQKKPLLPMYRKNRFGHKVNLLNIQYLGSLSTLESELINAGWKSYDDSMLTRILEHMSTKSREKALPILSELYNNRKPALIMTNYEKSCDCMIVFRLWPSNYFINHLDDNLWIGSIFVNHQTKLQKPALNRVTLNPAKDLPLSENLFQTRQVLVDPKMPKQTVRGIHPSILLIKEVKG